MDALGLTPVTEYLDSFQLPSYPSILNEITNNNADPNRKFDWVQSIAMIKRVFGIDILIGFDIFPDPANRTRNRIVLGTPETETVLPL